MGSGNLIEPPAQSLKALGIVVSGHRTVMKAVRKSGPCRVIDGVTGMFFNTRPHLGPKGIDGYFRTTTSDDRESGYLTSSREFPQGREKFPLREVAARPKDDQGSSWRYPLYRAVRTKWVRHECRRVQRPQTSQRASASGGTNGGKQIGAWLNALPADPELIKRKPFGDVSQQARGLRGTVRRPSGALASG